MKTLLAGLAIFLLAASPAFAELHVTMHDGRVSIVAKDVTVRQILIEWARIGQTKFVNVEKIPGGPVTLVLDNVTEMQALEVLLRPLSGFIAAPRAVITATVSAYDRIIIMPTFADTRPFSPGPATAPVTATAAVAPPAYQAPVYQPPAPVAQTTDEEQSTEPPPAGSPQAIAASARAVAAGQGGASGSQAGAADAQAVAASSEPAGNPPPNTYLRGLEVGRAQMRAPSRTPVPSTGAPSPPVGVAVPGMIAGPPPRQPGQPGQPPVAPGQPARRPGGL
jgi:hypothetical protein